MSTEPDPTHAPTATCLAALYQVTARWYANDAQLIWRRIALFTTLNFGLVTAQVFALHLHLVIRMALPVLGIAFSSYWLWLIRRTWRYQDYQKAVLRDQERAMGLEHLGGFSRVWAIRHPPQQETVEISGLSFRSSELIGSRPNLYFTIILGCVFIFFHLVLLFAAVAGISLEARQTPPVSTPAATTPPAKPVSMPVAATHKAPPAPVPTPKP